MKRVTFTTGFFIRPSRINSKGETPIIMRINVNGQREEFKIPRYINPSKWNAVAGMAAGHSIISQEINNYLNTAKARVLQIHRNMEMDNIPITSREIKNKFLGIGDKPDTFLTIYKKYVERTESLIGSEICKYTYYRIVRVCRYTQEYIQKKYGKDDINYQELNVEFIEGLRDYLRYEKKLSPNTTVKSLREVKKIVLKIEKKGLIKCDPFEGISLGETKGEIKYLEENELLEIYNKKFHSERITKVRDIFIVCCFTGLAYSDIAKLKPEDIFTDSSGDKWIIKTRTKTNERYFIPLLSIPLQIFDKYSTDKETIKKGLLLPMKSNVKLNEYLKEIQEVCGIKLHLTMHVARHTFATMSLTAGMTMEAVSKMLGHSTTKETERYAKVIMRKVSKEFISMRDIYDKNPENLQLPA